MTSQHLRNLVQREVQALQHQYWICNPMTKVCHVPAVPETCIDNARWVTLCGWNNGTSLYRKQMTKPTEHYCAKCKYLANIKEIDLDSEDDSWETLVRTGGGDSIVTYHMWLHRPWKQMHLTLTATPQTTLCEVGKLMMDHWNNHTCHRHLKLHTHTISSLTLAVFQDKPAGRNDESATIHEHRSLEASPRGRYTTRSRDRRLPHTHRFDIRHRLRRVQTRHSRTRGVVRQIQSRNHIWRQQDRSHRRGPTWRDESISHRHTQVHYQETRLHHASRTSTDRHNSPQCHYVERLRGQNTKDAATRDLCRPSRSIQQSHD